jgi:hypothetical protein
MGVNGQLHVMAALNLISREQKAEWVSELFRMFWRTESYLDPEGI